MIRRVKYILVRNPKGQLVRTYAPNFIGKSQLELMKEAMVAAKSINGKVDFVYFR